MDLKTELAKMKSDSTYERKYLEAEDRLKNVMMELADARVEVARLKANAMGEVVDHTDPDQDNRESAAYWKNEHDELARKFELARSVMDMAKLLNRGCDCDIDYRCGPCEQIVEIRQRAIAVEGLF